MYMYMCTHVCPQVLYLNMALVLFFVVVECLEVYEDGTNGTPPTEYFSNMWNLMDWCGFILFLLLFIESRRHVDDTRPGASAPRPNLPSRGASSPK